MFFFRYTAKSDPRQFLTKVGSALSQEEEHPAFAGPAYRGTQRIDSFPLASKENLASAPTIN
jgi:hypothetical protein